MRLDVSSWAPRFLLVAVVLLALAALRPPSPVPPGAPAGEFSAHRAAIHLESIAREPHVLGSAQLAKVREYLVAQLEALGLEAQIQEATAVRSGRGGLIGVGPVANVYARIPGSTGTSTVLLAAHYDSMPFTAGAADDGAAVAALLETARALAAGPPLAQDVLLLFTDGEEAGLLGAQAFVDDLPAGPPVAAVLNFEARGVSGPSLMFETSPGNGPLLDALAGSGTRTFALSWAALAYTVIGNRTDFTVFREAGLDGLNFAFIHGPSAYHSKVDSLPNLDLGSLQHHGELALGLARNLASRPELAKTLGEGGPDRVYFDLLGHVLVRYSKAFALGLAVLLAGALLVLLLRSRRGGGPSFLRLLLGAVVAAAASVAVALLSAAAALVLLVPDGDVQLAGGWSSDSLVRGGLVLAAFGLALGFLRWISRRLGSGALAMGGLTLWTLLTLLVSLRLPAASFLFAWPLAAALAAAFLWLPQPATAPRKGGGLLLGLGLCALVTGVLWTPSLALLGVALGRPAVPVTGLLLGLLCFGPLVLLLAQRPGLEGVPHKTPAWAWVGVGLGLAAAVQVFTGHDSRWPGPDSLFYLADLDQGESRWLSQDRSVDAWTSRFLGDSPAAEPQPRLFGVPGQVLVAEAALLDGLPSLSVAGRPLTEDDPTEMEITVDGECDRLILFLESKGLASLSLGGKTFGFPEPWEIPGYPTAVALLYYRYRPGDLGLTVERLSTRDSLKVEAVCQNLGLPASEIRRLGDRPATLMPRPGWFSDSTLVRRTVAL